MSYTAWLTDTARKEFAIRAGLAAVSQFERDHRTFTPEEISAAEEWAATALKRATSTGSRACAMEVMLERPSTVSSASADMFRLLPHVVDRIGC